MQVGVEHRVDDRRQETGRTQAAEAGVAFHTIDEVRHRRQGGCRDGNDIAFSGDQFEPLPLDRPVVWRLQHLHHEVDAIRVAVEVNAVAVRVQFFTELVGKVESFDHLVDFGPVRFREVDPQQVVVFERLVDPRLDVDVSVSPSASKR